MTGPEFPWQPQDEEGPVFKEPWEAQAFSLVVALQQQGCFSWGEWAAALSEAIDRAQQQGDPDLGNTYYRHWLGALEKLAAKKGLADVDAMLARKEQWRSAYLNTPHGEPVRLDSTTLAG
jgi:nitrile hydratase accessory protein